MNLHFNGPLSVFFQDTTLRNIAWKLSGIGQPTGIIVPDDPVPPSYGISGAPKATLDTVEFGDGYMQVTESGVNAVKRVFNVQWIHVRTEVGTALRRFFEGEGENSIYYRRPSEWFFWRPPKPFATDLPIKIITLELPKIEIVSWNDVNITAVFTETFAP